MKKLPLMLGFFALFVTLFSVNAIAQASPITRTNLGTIFNLYAPPVESDEKISADTQRVRHNARTGTMTLHLTITHEAPARCNPVHVSVAVINPLGQEVAYFTYQTRFGSPSFTEQIDTQGVNGLYTYRVGVSHNCSEGGGSVSGQIVDFEN